MIETKKFCTLTAIAILLVVSISFLSFYIAEETENLITGDATARAYIIPLPPENCSIDLREGWNFVSFYCEIGDFPINETLIDENNNTISYSKIFAYDSTKVNDPWISYNPSLPNYTTQQLDEISREHGYWIYMNTSDTYSKEGLNFDETPITLTQGWNLIGYPTKNSKNITEVFSTITDYYNRTESYQYLGNVGVWLFHMPPNTGTLFEMEPKIAYWVQVNETTGVTVNW